MLKYFNESSESVSNIIWFIAQSIDIVSIFRDLTFKFLFINFLLVFRIIFYFVI